MDVAGTIWSLLNLRSNPFFQQRLWEGAEEEYPLELLVGRHEQAAAVLREMKGERSSRHVIVGPPGVGKTTLAQFVKHLAAKDGYVVEAGVVAATANDTAIQLLLQVLSYVYQAVLLSLPKAADSPAMEDARQLLRALRFQGKSGGIQVLGSGITFGSQTSVAQPMALSLDEVVRLLEDVVRVACRDYPRGGVVVHVNNLENLSGGDLERATAIFAEIRDVFLLRDLHWIFVGTEDAVGPILYGRKQVASVMPFADPLEALSPREFDDVLERRYSHLQIDPAKPVVEPVERGAATALYTLFDGDLRGSLRGLQEATTRLIGLGEASAIEPISEQTLFEILQPRYAAEADLRLSDTLREHLTAIAEFGREPFTQQQVQGRLDVSQARVSQILSEFEQLGYVRRHGREGRVIQYVLAGPARLAFGMV